MCTYKNKEVRTKTQHCRTQYINGAHSVTTSYSLYPCHAAKPSKRQERILRAWVDAVVVVIIVFLSLSFGASNVNVALHSSNAGRLSILDGVDGEVASQADRKNIRRLDASVSAAEVNPLAIPTSSDDIFKLNVSIAHITLTCFLAEDRGLIATKFRIGVVSVWAMHVNREGWSTSYTVQNQPSVTVFVGAIHTRIAQLSKCWFALEVHWK